MKISLFARAVLICGWLWLPLLSGCGSSADLGDMLPERIGEAQRTEFVTGEDAGRAVSSLHGKHIAVQDAAVAVYGEGHPPACQVWVSRASNAAGAREQLAVMINRMMRPGGPFSEPEKQRRAGVDLYRVDGLGMAHYVWSRGDLVWWVATLEPDGGPFLPLFLEPEGA